MLCTLLQFIKKNSTLPHNFIHSNTPSLTPTHPHPFRVTIGRVPTLTLSPPSSWGEYDWRKQDTGQTVNKLLTGCYRSEIW